MAQPRAARTPDSLLDDAKRLWAMALEKLRRDDIRDAALEAWGATIQATKALVAARTGQVPADSTRPRVQFSRLLIRIDALQSLSDKYVTRQALLHGQSFYNGNCEPQDHAEMEIRTTHDYIDEARRRVAFL